ncbi:MAG: glycosyltransferase [bacterium]|nr:glycosyltransferase [bacterium]
MKEVKKIGIDARFFGSKDKGFGRYVENLIKNLENIDKTNQYFIFLNKDREKDYIPRNPNFRKIPINHNFLWPLKVDKKIQNWELDIIHFTCLPFPLFYRTKNKIVITVHDLIWRIFPPFKNPLKIFFYRLSFSNAIKKANAVIAVSKHTQKDILEIYKINKEKTKVIYEGVN